MNNLDLAELNGYRINLARALAQKMHFGMTYRSDFLHSMYENHIVPVAGIVWNQAMNHPYRYEYSYCQELYIAALLHDTVEDTDITVEDIHKIFGPIVSDLVWRVTDEPGQNRKEKKIKTYPKIRASKEAVLIKLADRIINTTNSNKMDMYRSEYPEFRSALYVEGEWDSLWETLDKNHDYIA